MNITWMVLSACMMFTNGTNKVCKDFNIPLDDVTKIQCERHSQIILSVWSRDHENWKIDRYKCIEEKSKEENI